MAPRPKRTTAATAAPKTAPAKASKSTTATKAKATTTKATATTTKASTTAKSTAKATSKPAPKSAPKSAAAAKPKAAATKKAAPAKSKAADKPVKNGNGKRPIDDDEEEEEEEPQGSAEPSEPRPQKRARVAAAAAPTGWRKQVVLKRRKRNVVSNPVPTAPLDVFVFGEGSSGELGLGSKKHEGKKPIDVKRPRINHNLDAEKVGIVDIACGGMHVVALTKDNRVLTWGVNDDKALGRDTTWSGGVRDVDAEESDDDDDDDTGVNPNESTPTQIENGELDEVQPTPMLIAPLQDITDIACGANHVVALDVHGKVWTWGSGGQFQLGRKPLTRHGGPTATLQPEPCGMFGKRHYAVSIAAGSYHSFYIDNQQRVWSWGLNNYSQTGQYDDTGKDDAMILQPKLVQSLDELDIDMIAGGEHHTVARTKDGKLLTWGRVDGHQVGQPTSLFNEDNAMFDENKRPRILLKPTAVPDINAKFVTAGVDTSFAIDTAGKVYSWGFSANYQTGQGTTDDIEVPTVIDNTAIRGREIVWAGAGGQFSVVAAEHGAKGSPRVQWHRWAIAVSVTKKVEDRRWAYSHYSFTDLDQPAPQRRILDGDNGPIAIDLEDEQIERLRAVRDA
ncbi:hypothetical protein NPX13_g10221 [Xylaria arbuscula]|uniref:RCC1-like domain-containing protein n=1 Tax=Xylaria arbuscula TaxID=114810 RepID=A0A9W8TGS6_9PEZI|nr:hypothetical protein NPX13_g10221 [Xylaria arbuscula]